MKKSGILIIISLLSAISCGQQGIINLYHALGGGY